MNKKRFAAVTAVLLVAALLCAVLTACGKPSIVTTEEGKKLTSHAWETNYVTHSEVRFETDGTLVVTVDDLGDMVDVPGTWKLEGQTLTTVISKQFDTDGELIEKPNTSVYAYASYMSDSIIDDGDKSIVGAEKEQINLQKGAVALTAPFALPQSQMLRLKVVPYPKDF